MKKKDEINRIRKVTDGAVRNKERTMQKMITAVGQVLKEKGYAGLTPNNIVRKAGVDRKLIIDYFGHVNNLIEAYLVKNDYWMNKVAPKMQAIAAESDHFAANEIITILHTLFEEVYASSDLQKILVWEVSEYQEKVRELVDNKEALGKALFAFTEKDFLNTDINQRAVLALQIAGIYHLILHANACGSTFCEINIHTPEGEKAIKEALTKVITLIYRDAKEQQSRH